MARSHAGHTSLPAGDPDTWLMHVMSATLVVAVLLVVAWWVLRDALAQRREAASKATYSVAGTVRRAGGLGALALLAWFVFPLPSWLVWAVPVLGTLVSEVELSHARQQVVTLSAHGTSAPVGRSMRPTGSTPQARSSPSPATPSGRIDDVVMGLATPQSQMATPRVVASTGRRYGLPPASDTPTSADRAYKLEQSEIHAAVAMSDNSYLPGGGRSEMPSARHRRTRQALAKASTALALASSPSVRSQPARAAATGALANGARTPHFDTSLGSGTDYNRRVSMGTDGVMDMSMGRSASGSPPMRTPSSGGRMGRVGELRAQLPPTVALAGSPLMLAERERVEATLAEFNREAAAVEAARKAAAAKAANTTSDDDAKLAELTAALSVSKKTARPYTEDELEHRRKVLDHLNRKQEQIDALGSQTADQLHAFFQRKVTLLQREEQLQRKQAEAEKARAEQQVKDERRRRAEAAAAAQRKAAEEEAWKKQAEEEAKKQAAEAENSVEARQKRANERLDRLFNVTALRQMDEELKATMALVRANPDEKRKLWAVRKAINYGNTLHSLNGLLAKLLKGDQRLIHEFAAGKDSKYFRLALSVCFEQIVGRINTSAVQYLGSQDPATHFSAAARLICLLVSHTKKERGAEVFMMTMYRVCPMTQHEWPAATQDLTRVGWDRVIALMAAVFSTEITVHGHTLPSPFGGAPSLWRWLSRTLNQAAADPARVKCLPFVLFPFLKFGGSCMSHRYKRQFLKLLECIRGMVPWAKGQRDHRADQLEDLITAALELSRRNVLPVVPVPQGWALPETVTNVVVGDDRR